MAPSSCSTRPAMVHRMVDGQSRAEVRIRGLLAHAADGCPALPQWGRQEVPGCQGIYLPPLHGWSTPRPPDFVKTNRPSTIARFLHGVFNIMSS